MLLDPFFVQGGDLLLVQKEDHLLAQDENPCLAQEEDLLLAQARDLLLVQIEGSPSCARRQRTDIRVAAARAQSRSRGHPYANPATRKQTDEHLGTNFPLPITIMAPPHRAWSCLP